MYEVICTDIKSSKKSLDFLDFSFFGVFFLSEQRKICVTSFMDEALIGLLCVGRLSVVRTLDRQVPRLR